MDMEDQREFNNDFNEVIEEQRGRGAEIIAARRQHIKDTALCTGCRTDLKTCRTMNKGQPGRDGVCCGTHQHRRDPKALDELLDEIAAGGPIRTVAEVDPPLVLGPLLPSYTWLLHQDEWWYPHRRPAIRIVDMEKPHRYNTARYIERRADRLADREYWRMASWASSPFGPGGDMAVDAFEGAMAGVRRDPLGWLRETPLLQRLRRGLPTKGRKLEALQERARHWSTCPLRLPAARRPEGARCACPPKVDVPTRTIDGDPTVGGDDQP